LACESANNFGKYAFNRNLRKAHVASTTIYRLKKRTPDVEYILCECLERTDTPGRSVSMSIRTASAACRAYACCRADIFIQIARKFRTQNAVRARTCAEALTTEGSSVQPEEAPKSSLSQPFRRPTRITNIKVGAIWYHAPFSCAPACISAVSQPNAAVTTIIGIRYISCRPCCATTQTPPSQRR
jgi:hypothetical protein